MSKIVLMKAQLAMPTVLDDLLQKLHAQNPALAEWIEGLDTHSLIKECANNALKQLSSQKGISLEDSVADYYGKQYTSHSGLSILGALKTDKLPNGLGVMVNSDGSIQFAADEYQHSWKMEIKRLQTMFQQIFLQEVVKTFLQITGYEVQSQTASVSDPDSKEEKQAFVIEGVKQ